MSRSGSPRLTTPPREHTRHHHQRLHRHPYSRAHHYHVHSQRSDLDPLADLHCHPSPLPSPATATASTSAACTTSAPTPTPSPPPASTTTTTTTTATTTTDPAGSSAATSSSGLLGDMAPGQLLTQFQRALREAVRTGDCSGLRRLLEAREGKINLNVFDTEGQTALHQSCQRGDLELVKVLVSFGADVRLANRDGWSALHIAAYGGHTDILLFLMACRRS